MIGTNHCIVGGFGKWPNVKPDLVHSYFALAGLSIVESDDLLPIDSRLGVTLRALEK